MFQCSPPLVFFFLIFPLRFMSISDFVPQAPSENRKAMNSFDFVLAMPVFSVSKLALAICKKLYSLCYWPLFFPCFKNVLLFVLMSSAIFFSFDTFPFLSFSFTLLQNHVYIHRFCMNFSFPDTILFYFSVGSMSIDPMSLRSGALY